MRSWFLTRTRNGGICSTSRAAANQLRNNLPEDLHYPTVKVIPLEEVRLLVACMEKHTKIMAAAGPLTRGEIAVHKAAIRDIKGWFGI